MSGIFGIAARFNSVPVLLQGLQQLEQPDDNHCGLVVHGRQGLTTSPPRLHRHRRAQRITAWLDTLATSKPQSVNHDHVWADALGLHGVIGMGHTGRTDHSGRQNLPLALPQLSHGPNAHLNSPARVAVVLQGEPYVTPALREAIEERGYILKTGSDAELLAHLIDATCQNDPQQAVHRAMSLLDGCVAIGVMFHDQPNRLFAIHRGLPLYWGEGHEHSAWASEIKALPADIASPKFVKEMQVLEIDPHTDCQAD